MAEITKTVENVDIDFAEIVVNGTSYESSNYVPSQSESSSSNNNSSTTTPAVTPSQEVENTTGQKVSAVLLNTVQHDIEDKSLTERVEILEEGLETESETRLQQDLSLDSKIDTSVSTLNTRIDNITPQSIGAIPTTEKAEPLGVATLDANGRLEASQLPNNSRRLVGTIDASSQHDLPSTSLYTSGDEFLVIKDGYINQSTAFTLTAGNTLTDLEVTQANALIIEGYVFTLYEGETTLGTVIGFATDKVNLEGGTVINLPYASDLSATSVPDAVEITVKTGDTFINIDNHWIHLTNTSSVDSVNGMTGAVVLPVDDEISETSENPVQNKVLAQALKTAGKVKTVNEQTPDENGNITTDKELTLVQYEALSEEEKNNGTNYFVKDVNTTPDTYNYISALCLTDSAEQTKVVSMDNYIATQGCIIGVTFTNANTYGDSTLETPTYPVLSVNGILFDICDSRGHTAGTGCWGNGDYIEFRISGNKAIIINSDIRQQVTGESGYTIYSNGKIVYTSIINGVGTDLTLKKKTVTATANSYGIIYKGSTFTSTEKILGTEKVVYAVCTSGDDNIVRLGYHRSNGIWLQVIGYSGTYASNTSITITFYYL